MNNYGWKDFICDLFGHADGYKPHPYSSAWQQPKHKQPQMRCKRCGKPLPRK